MMYMKFQRAFKYGINFVSFQTSNQIKTFRAKVPRVWVRMGGVANRLNRFLKDHDGFKEIVFMSSGCQV